MDICVYIADNSIIIYDDYIIGAQQQHKTAVETSDEKIQHKRRDFSREAISATH